MFWIPGISLLVFFLILVPSTILGFKKGWRGAVFVSLLLLAFTGIWIGMGYLIYDSFLWPFYRDHILTKDLKVAGLNLNSLQETFQLRIVLVVAGILTPLSYLAVYIIWKLSSEKINKYMGPKTKEVSDHEKQVIYRKSTVASRTAGVTIMGATTLFISSLVASAVSVMTVPYSHRDGMTKFNDKLGSLYGFGQVGNTETASALQSFMKEVDSEMIQALQEMAMIGTDGAQRTPTNNFKTDVSKVNSLFSGNNGMRWEVLKELMLDNHQAGAMFVKMALDSMSSQLKNDPLKWDASTNNDLTDSVGNTIGYGVSRSFLLDDLKNYFQHSSNKLKYHLTNEVINTFVENYTKRIIPFADTIFAKKKVDKENDVAKLQSTLKERINSLSSNEKKLDSIQKEIAANVQLVGQINGQGYDHQTVDATAAGHTTKTFSYDKYTMRPEITNPEAGSKLYDANSQYTTALNLFNTFKTTQYDPARQAKENSFNTLNTMANRKSGYDTDIRIAEASVNAAQAELNSRSSELKQATQDRQKAGDEKNRLDKLKHDKESLKIKNTSTISSLTTSISNLESSNIQLNSEISTLESSLQTKNAELQTAQSPSSGTPDQNLIDTLKSEILSIESQINIKRASVTTNESTIHSQESQKSKLEDDNINLDSEIRNIASLMATQDSLLASATNKINTLQGSGTASISTAQNNLHDAEVLLNNKKIILSNFMTNDYNPAQSQYKHDLDAFAALKPRYDQLNRDQSNKKDFVDLLTEKLRKTKEKINLDNDELNKVVTEILKLIADKVAWDPTVQTTTNHTDDDSIVFARKELQYQNVVLNNIKVIYNAKLQIYNNNKRQLIDIYSNWLRGK